MQGMMFKEPLFRKVVGGTKTETRRVVRGNLGKVPVERVSEWTETPDSDQRWWATPGGWIKPRYRVGEVVYLKEPWFVPPCPCCDGGDEFANCLCGHVYHKFGTADLGLPDSGIKWRNKMFMPARYARHFIRILDVRCERLREIDEEGAWREGIPRPASVETYVKDEALYDFELLWDSINRPPHAWTNDPFVWRYRFETCDREDGR